MSLMSRIGRGLLGKAKPKPETQLRVAINQRNAEANPPKAKSAETRKRMSESQLRRNAPVEPVPTSALPTPPAPIVEVVIAAPPPAPFITPPQFPPVPPRPEFDLVKSLEAVPLPAPAAVPPAPVLTGRGSCKARNPATGIQCALLAGHTKLHRHGSTEFRFGAAPGTSSFPRRDALEVAAHGRPDSPFTT